MAEGKIVISDRYADATFAYQGAGRGFPETTIDQIIELATSGLKSDLTLFFDLPIEKALLRTNKRNDSGEQKNRMDKETSGFYERVRTAYLKIAANEPERFRIIDADGSTDQVQSRVVEIVTEFLGSS